MKRNYYLLPAVIIFMMQSCMKLPESKLAKCIPAEYSKDYILLIQYDEEHNNAGPVRVPITKNGNTSTANGTYSSGSYGLNFERQVKKYFKGRYELSVPDMNFEDDYKRARGDSSEIKYPLSTYRYVFMENIGSSKTGPVYTYFLYDRLENKYYNPVRRMGTHLFAPILQGLNKKMGL